MRTRTIGGLIACTGLAASAAAQQPAATLVRPQPTVTQVGGTGGTGSNYYQPPSYQATSPAGYQSAGYQTPGYQTSGASVYQTVGGQTATGPSTNLNVSPRPVQTTPGAQAPATGNFAPGPFPSTAASALTTPQTGYPGATPGYGACSTPGNCGPSGSSCDCLCGPPGKVWIGAEYLYWVARGGSIPPLATTSPAGTSQANAGNLAAPGTGVLFGGGKYNDDWRSGFRTYIGTWLDDAQTFGVEGNFFFLGQSTQRFGFGSNGSTIISRPFFNTQTGAQDSELVSYPGVLAGTVSGTSTSNLIGGGANFIRNLCCDPCGRWDLTLGYRYINLRDDLTINENLTALPGSSAPSGTQFLITDHIHTNNSFNGVPIGINWERRFSHYFIGVRSSVALGVMTSTTTIDGSTTIIAPGGGATTYPGGLLTQPSNIGKYTNNHFAVVPEVGVKVGAQVTERLRAYVSYNFLYMSSVQRAGDQVDLRVNTNQIAPGQNPLTGPALPAFSPRTTDYWVQGIGFGVEYRF